MPEVVLHPDAERELEDAAVWLEREREYYGVLFLDAYDTVVQRLLEYPRAGKRVGRSVRRWILRGWHYSLLYSIEEYGIYILAVAHQSRRSNYWRDRL